MRFSHTQNVCMDKHTTTLIEGNFELENAKSLLLDLVSRKINYHQIRKFSNTERFGNDPEHSEQRIAALTQEKEALSAWLTSQPEDKPLRITCHIVIETE